MSSTTWVEFAGQSSQPVRTQKLWPPPTGHREDHRRQRRRRGRTRRFVRSEKQIEVARRSLEIVGREADITVNRNEAGANSKFDVVRAQGLVAQVRASIPPLEGQRRSALFQLAALLGRTPTMAPTEVNQCITPPRLSDLIPVGDGATLLKRTP